MLKTQNYKKEYCEKCITKVHHKSASRSASQSASRSALSALVQCTSAFIRFGQRSNTRGYFCDISFAFLLYFREINYPANLQNAKKIRDFTRFR